MYKSCAKSHDREKPRGVSENAVVDGVPKAGTTALHAALARHPGLYLSEVKEPKFFLTDGPWPVTIWSASSGSASGWHVAHSSQVPS